MAWERKRNTETDAKGSRTLEHLMTFLRLEVQGEEMVQLAKSGFGTPIRKKIPQLKVLSRPCDCISSGEFRKVLRKEYLSELIQKQNDNRVREPRIGEMVLIGNDNKKRLSWPIAKIIELIPGRDGEIRTVRLKTQHGTVIRPVQRIFPLEVQAIANSDKELKEESVSVKSTKPEKVLNINDAIIKKIYFFWKIG
ncbi:DUF5641 domain-containing protein [Trichonephila clavipes]|nr:DUF5641 domain-containing protein [Trichonephila clavipes]